MFGHALRILYVSNLEMNVETTHGSLYWHRITNYNLHQTFDFIRDRQLDIWNLELKNTACMWKELLFWYQKYQDNLPTIRSGVGCKYPIPFKTKLYSSVYARGLQYTDFNPDFKVNLAWANFPEKWPLQS